MWRYIKWSVPFLIFGFLCIRAVGIISQHSECFDDHYHLIRGLGFWHLNTNFDYNDPPLGEAIESIPLLFMNWNGEIPIPDNVRYAVGIWKCLLFMPFLWVVFLWCKELFNTIAACSAIIILLLEPTITAHLHLASLDVLGMEAIFITCYFLWKFFLNVGYKWFWPSALLVSLALLIKHTAIILPFVALIFAICSLDKKKAHPFKFAITKFVLLFGLVVALIILLTIIDPSLYFRSIRSAIDHGKVGHSAYLLGNYSQHGWWYYFPILLWYKTPLGIWAILAVGLASFMWRKIRVTELGLIIPLVCWTLFLCSSGINIGFRHFLPAYAFLIIFAVRWITTESILWIWICLALVLVESHRWFPDYLSYSAYPNVCFEISDSNVDWGQGLKQTKEWIHNHNTTKPIYVGAYNSFYVDQVKSYVGKGIIPLKNTDPIPTSGILIISPIWITGQYDCEKRYSFLRDRKPTDVIGHSMLVFDLEHYEN